VVSLHMVGRMFGVFLSYPVADSFTVLYIVCMPDIRAQQNASFMDSFCVKRRV